MNIRLPSSPNGFKLRHTLRGGHNGSINRMEWSPDGQYIASASYDKKIIVWDVNARRAYRVFQEHEGAVYDVAWSPDGSRIASSSADHTVMIWDVHTGKSLWTFPKNHADVVYTVIWSPDSKYIISGSKDRSFRVWDVRTGKESWYFQDFAEIYHIAWAPQSNIVAVASKTDIKLWDIEQREMIKVLRTPETSCLVWSTDGRLIASRRDNHTVTIWNTHVGLQAGILEGHTDRINSVSISADNQLVATKSSDGSFRLWRNDTWELLASVPEAAPKMFHAPSLAFHPSSPTVLATLDDNDRSIRIWDLDMETLVQEHPESLSLHYTSAKVALLGSTGAGKSALGLVLSGQEFTPTTSTHGRQIWSFARDKAKLPNGKFETREILLWDVAGQPDYRLVHQLHLNEVDVALIVVTTTSQVDPFASVRDWNRALRAASKYATKPLIKFLVFTRIDRGRVRVNREDMQAIQAELGLDGIFETSAARNLGIEELKQAIRKAIDWRKLPRVSSTDLFQNTKAFLLGEKKAGRALARAEDLYTDFLEAMRESRRNPFEINQEQFNTCILLLEAHGLLKRFNFGNYVLLRPEYVDAYASAIILFATSRKNGLGEVAEDRIKSGSFDLDIEDRLERRQDEELLILATIDDLVTHEIALREKTARGELLVFPSQFTREAPAMPPEYGSNSVMFTFEGPVLNIYASLAVRLAYSEDFGKPMMFKNTIIYEKGPDHFGIQLKELDEGKAELKLIFSRKTRTVDRLLFRDIVHGHLDDRAVTDSVNERRIIACPNCTIELDDKMVKTLRTYGTDQAKIRCPFCNQADILLVEPEISPVVLHTRRLRNAQIVDKRKQYEERMVRLDAKRKVREFDVLLLYHEQDRAEVERRGGELQGLGLLPWIDVWNASQREAWIRQLKKDLRNIKSVAICVGRDHEDFWRRDNLADRILRQFAEHDKRIIPVRLPSAQRMVDFHNDYQALDWVDFTLRNPNPLEMFYSAITGD